MKQKLINGDEKDAISKFRNVHFWQRGEIKRIKNALNRRLRQESKREIKDDKS
jgi:hypothetical protein